MKAGALPARSHLLFEKRFIRILPWKSLVRQGPFSVLTSLPAFGKGGLYLAYKTPFPVVPMLFELFRKKGDFHDPFRELLYLSVHRF